MHKRYALIINPSTPNVAVTSLCYHRNQFDLFTNQCDPRRMKKQQRSLNLIANFQDGYSTDLAFVLPAAFRAALDMTFDTRKKDGEAYQVWTQGNIYSFKRGDTIYDQLTAYTEDWQTALKTMKLCLDVQDAQSVALDPNAADGLYHGSVWFHTLVPTTDKIKVEKKDSYTCTQFEFVELLKTGTLKNKIKIL